MLSNRINSYFDRVISLNVHIGKRKYSAFKVWGAAAFTLALLVGLALGFRRGLPFWALLLGITLSFSTFFVVAMVTKILSGVESLTFYHQLISVTAVIAGAAWLLSQPILLTMDIIVVAVVATLTFGRIGCLMVGCCHGRPCRLGVCYGVDHGAAGFTPELVGLRLFPIQIVEFLFAIVITLVGSLMIWNGHAPGAAASWFLASYCATRFCFEFARWPPSYQFRLGLSQYQWISIVLIVFNASLQLIGVLPFQLWHLIIAAGLLAITIGAVIERRLRSFEKDLTHPDHRRELFRAIEALRARTGRPMTLTSAVDPALLLVSITSLGLQVSASKWSESTGDVFLCAVSLRNGKLTDTTLRSLAKMIEVQEPDTQLTKVLPGNHGVVHFLVHLNGSAL